MGNKIVITALAFLALNAGNAIGYETDVHYGLTLWLAKNAGLSIIEAEEIARANERTDTGVLDAKHAIIWHLCIMGADTASEVTRRYHFRSQVPVPADPPARPVDPRAKFANLEVDNIIKEKGTNLADRLGRFGLALHGLQDTYSHAGESDTAWPCPRRWMWAHPDARGGYRSHKADLTYTDVPSCIEMASVTFDAASRLVESLGRAKAKPPLQMTKDIGAFCSADSRPGKADWFSKKGMGHLAKSILRTTSLKSGIEFYDDVPNLDVSPKMPPTVAINRAATTATHAESLAKVRAALQAAPIPSDVHGWFDNFFRSWFAASQQQLSKIASDFFAESIDVWPGMKQKPKDPASFLLFWRIRDRDQAESLAFAEQAFKNPLTSKQFASSTSEWQSNFILERLRERPYLLGQSEGPRGVTYIAISILKRSPADAIIFVAQRGDKGLRITRATSIVFH